MTYGVDLGPTHTDVDFALLKSKGVQFVVLKATQGDYRWDSSLPRKVDAALQAGLIVGLYHWCDPLRGAGQQADFFLEKTAPLAYDFAAVDVEQHWADWSEWPYKITKILAPSLISQRAQESVAAIAGGISRRVAIYTRASFVHEYAQPMLAWLKDWPLWLAHWPYAPGRVVCSWEEWFERHAPALSGPALPRGCTQWAFWQLSGDKFVLPGLNGAAVEIDRFTGSLAALQAWCGRLEKSTENTPERVEKDMQALLGQLLPAAAGLRGSLVSFEELLQSLGRLIEKGEG